MKKLLGGLLLAGLVFVSGAPAVHAATAAELQAQVQALINEVYSMPGGTVAELQAQVNLLKQALALQVLVNQLIAQGQGGGGWRQSSSLRLTVPNGGEQWQLGDTHTILWTPYDPDNGINPAISQVNAYLEKRVNGNFITLGKIIESGKASIHWSGDLDTYGNLPTPGDGYYVRLVNTVTGETDRSNNPFRLVSTGTIHATLSLDGSHNAITSVPAAGRDVSATWSSNAANCSMSVNSNQNAEYVQYDNVGSSGSRTLHITPNTYSVSLWCNSSSPVEGTAGDYVNGPAGVVINNQPASIKVISPNGGESFSLSGNQTITYAPNNLSSVSIALYRNDASYAWIGRDISVGGIGGQGSLSWVPSQFISASDLGNGAIFKIYIIGYKSDGTGTVEDKSDAPFTITGGTSSSGLSVIDITASANPILGGVTATWTATIKNNGTTASVPTSFTLNGSTDTIPTIAPGATTQRTATSGLTLPGPNTVCARIDFSSTNPTDFCKTFTVTPTFTGEGTKTLHSWDSLLLNNGLVLYADSADSMGGDGPIEVKFKFYTSAGTLLADSDYLYEGQTKNIGVASGFTPVNITVNSISYTNSGTWSVTFNVTSGTPVRPAYVTDLHASVQSDGTSVLVAWSPASGAQGYDLYISSDSSVPLNNTATKALAFGLSPSATSFTDHRAAGWTGTYYYKLFPLGPDRSTQNSASNIASMTAPTAATPSIAITNLSSTSVCPGDTVTISWQSTNAPADSAVRLLVGNQPFHQSIGDGLSTSGTRTWQVPALNGQCLADVETLCNLSAGQTSLRAVLYTPSNACFGYCMGTLATTVASAQSALTVLAPAPFADSAISGTPVVNVPTVGNGRISLSWSTYPNATKYSLYRSTVSTMRWGTDPIQVIWVEGGATSYTDTGLTNGTTYYYAVSAWQNDTALTGWSNKAGATPSSTATASSQLASIISALRALKAMVK
ncbi:MAG: hypothetical protein WC764_01790 [Candidatus Paceibacterota bacterium]|jgi:hypothetical protein